MATLDQERARPVLQKITAAIVPDDALHLADRRASCLQAKLTSRKCRRVVQ